jgi:hypothetical protein
VTYTSGQASKRSFASGTEVSYFAGAGSQFSPGDYGIIARRYSRHRDEEEFTIRIRETGIGVLGCSKRYLTVNTDRANALNSLNEMPMTIRALPIRSKLPSATEGHEITALAEAGLGWSQNLTGNIQLRWPASRMSSSDYGSSESHPSPTYEYPLGRKSSKTTGDGKKETSLSADDATDGEHLCPVDYMSEGKVFAENAPEEPILALLRPEILRQLLQSFKACVQVQHNGSDNSTSHSASESMGSHRTNGGQNYALRRDFKRKRDEVGDEDSAYASQSSTAESSSKSRRKYLLACPFCKKDPQKYQVCYRHKITKISYVKLHLYRKHQLPLHCARCCITFKTEEAQDIHVIAGTCENRKPKPEWSGITRSQKQQLEMPVSSRLTEEEQWFTIWDILFPGQPRPHSPYVDSGLSEQLCSFQDFAFETGPAIICDLLIAEGYVAREPNLNGDVQTLRAQYLRTLQLVIADGFREIARQWQGPGETYSVPRTNLPEAYSISMSDGYETSIWQNSGMTEEPLSLSGDFFDWNTYEPAVN